MDRRDLHDQIARALKAGKTVEHLRQVAVKKGVDAGLFDRVAAEVLAECTTVV